MEQNKRARECAYFPRCGGCDRRQVEYARQLEDKTAYIRTLLKPFGGKVAECRGGSPEECRNKVHLAFATVDGKVRAGFFDARTHKVVPVAACPMHGDW